MHQYDGKMGQWHRAHGHIQQHDHDMQAHKRVRNPWHDGVGDGVLEQEPHGDAHIHVHIHGNVRNHRDVRNHHDCILRDIHV